MDALNAAGVPFDEARFVQTRFSMGGAYETAQQFFAAQPDTTAVFAMSDTVAIGVIRALKDSGKNVPGDVSVIENMMRRDGLTGQNDFRIRTEPAKTEAPAQEAAPAETPAQEPEGQVMGGH